MILYARRYDDSPARYHCIARDDRTATIKEQIWFRKETTISRNVFGQGLRRGPGWKEVHKHIVTAARPGYARSLGAFLSIALGLPGPAFRCRP